MGNLNSPFLRPLALLWWDLPCLNGPAVLTMTTFRESPRCPLHLPRLQEAWEEQVARRLCTHGPNQSMRSLLTIMMLWRADSTKRGPTTIMPFINRTHRGQQAQQCWHRRARAAHRRSGQGVRDLLFRRWVSTDRQFEGHRGRGGRRVEVTPRTEHADPASSTPSTGASRSRGHQQLNENHTPPMPVAELEFV